MVLQLYSSKDNLWREICMLFDKPIEFLVDTGSQVTLIPHAAAHDLGVDFSPAEGVEVHAYGGALVSILGVIINAKIAFGERSHESRVLITRDLFA